MFCPAQAQFDGPRPALDSKRRWNGPADGRFFIRHLFAGVHTHSSSPFRDLRCLATGPNSGDFFAHPSVLAIPFTLMNPFFEELLVRAYLMTEIVELTGSSALAIAVSVAVQTSYHLYYGWSGALSLAFLFLAFALYFARSRRALPVVVAHGVFDIYGLVRLW